MNIGWRVISSNLVVSVHVPLLFIRGADADHVLVPGDGRIPRGAIDLSRLVPPEIRAGSQFAAFEPEIPAIGIDRDDYLGQYRRSIPKPLPEGKTLDGELRGWAGSLGARKWVGERYTPTVALVTRSPKVRVDDPETIGELGRACREVIAPLGCYSAGWFSSLAALVPRGLRKPVSLAVREYRREAARKVRDNMITSEPPVIESFTAVRAFSRSGTGRAAVDEQAALDGFVSGIVRLLDAGTVGSSILAEDETLVLAELGERVVNDFGAVADEPLTARRHAELREVATSFAEAVIADRLPEKDRTDPHLAEAFERVVTTYVNRLHRGKSLVGTEYYVKLRLDAVRIDEIRRASVRRRHETEMIVAVKRRSGTAERTGEDPDEGSTNARRLFSAAARIIAEDPRLRVDGRPDWEARTAIELLTNAGNLDIGSSRQVRSLVADLWYAEQPTDARSDSSTAAGAHVWLIMQTASTRARRSIADTVPAGEVS